MSDRECVCGCGLDAFDYNEWVRSKRDMWKITHKPRGAGDKKPWKLVCPLKMPTMFFYEQGWSCYCRNRFKSQAAGERWVARRIFGEVIGDE